MRRCGCDEEVWLWCVVVVDGLLGDLNVYWRQFILHLLDQTEYFHVVNVDGWIFDKNEWMLHLNVYGGAGSAVGWC